MDVEIFELTDQGAHLSPDLLACSEVASKSETLVSIKSTNSFPLNCLGKPSTSCTEVSLLLAGPLGVVGVVCEFHI